jgi:glycosyltransferase involved in cell wall biosynthesis
LRILLIYYEPRPSGQTRHVLSLAGGLRRRGHHTVVVLPDVLKTSVRAFEEVGVRTVPLPLDKLVWRSQPLLRVARLIRDEHFDVVHVHSQEAGLAGRVIASLAGAKRVLYTPQTVDIRRRGYQWLYVVLERALAGVTDVIISVNESDHKRLLRWGIPAHKITTVVNGVDLEEFSTPVDRRAIRESLGLDPTRPLVLQVGQLRIQKDPLTFAEGAARVLQTCSEAQFVLVGEGPLRERMVAHVRKLRLEEYVRLVGWVESASRLMPASDLITLTSLWEGMPYALLEAMGWSRPIVATAVNGCPEVVEHGKTGLLVPAGDAVAWARAVVSLLTDPARANRMGIRGRKRLEERFTLQDMVSQVEALYAS